MEIDGNLVLSVGGIYLNYVTAPKHLTALTYSCTHTCTQGGGRGEDPPRADPFEPLGAF